MWSPSDARDVVIDMDSFLHSDICPLFTTPLLNSTSTDLSTSNTGTISEDLPNPRTMSLHIETFSGLSTDTPAQFLKDFESYCLLGGICDDRRRVAAFYLHLRGPARSWYTTIPADRQDTWACVRNAFSQRYISCPINGIADNHLFNTMCLSVSQALEEYHGELILLGSKLGKTDRDILLRFVDGLPDQLAFFVRAGHPQSCIEALNAAKSGEAYGYRKLLPSFPHVAAAQPVYHPPPIPSPEMSQLQNQVAHLTQELTNLRHKSQQQQTLPRRSNPTHYSQDGASECDKCHGRGHGQDTCNWNGSGQLRPNLKCQVCFQFGHGALKCLQYPTPMPPATQSGN